ncbi:uncharacterized protein LOC115925184 isoform X2 [Strongylocentrotus purpuratus]|uniref:Transmembrane protein n=1 Tax=Strongylocentrotus purpuratus TaxID=7668 RepID=A0A7M7T0C7_STRPU|nr:uncharacterized protein LOC115925184 isoform X2 [Strongylocentrotus purpuratus]
MYVPEGGRVEGGEQEVIHQVVTLLTSTASLVVLVLATFFCGMCYCFGGSKPDYDDDEGTTGFRNSDQEQKWPILNRSASLGERGAKNGGRTQSPVFVHQSSLRPRSESDESVAANNDESIATGYGTMGDSSIATRTTAEAHVEVADSFAQTSFEFESRRLQSFAHEVGSMYAEPVQPATKPGILHTVHSEPAMSLQSEYVHIVIFKLIMCDVLRAIFCREMILSVKDVVTMWCVFDN